MHEMSVVLNVVDTIDKFAEENSIQEIRGVVMQIGLASGVIPFYFQSCWEPASAKSKHLFGSSVNIEEIPGRCMCLDCGHVYELPDDHHAPCPACGSRNWRAIGGTDIIIKEILVEG